MLKFIINLFKKKLSDVYYQGRESVLGHHKRDIVVMHVDQACDSLKNTRDQFEQVLHQFETIVPIENTSLAQSYQHLQRQYEFCKGRADDVSHRIQLIEEASQSLFREWEAELTEYQNRTLRARSRQQLKKSKQQYSRLIKTMRKAEAQIAPVLAAFKDQVLFLKHNLNAQAIAALQHEFVEITLDISQLIEVMETTLREANQFVSILAEQKLLTS